MIEYSNNYSKTSGSLWHCYRDELSDILGNSELFQSKVTVTGKTPTAGNTKYFEIAVPLKFFSNFCRTLEMPLINYEINLILTWSTDCVISSAT